MTKNKTFIFLFAILIILIICILTFMRYPTVAVLGYHGFTKDKESSDNLIMNIDNFEKQLQYLKLNHYHTLTLKELYEYKENKRMIPIKSVLITMDDGYQSNYDLAFPLLKKYNMNAVVFYIGENKDKNDPNYMSVETLNKIKNEYPNIEIASHSYQLHERGAIYKGKEKIKNDFKKMKEIISTQYFAYPYGDYNQDIKEVLKEENYRLAFTFGPKENHRKMYFFDSNYEIPRFNISNDMPLWKFALRISLPF